MVDCCVLLFCGRGGSYATGEHPTPPTQFLFLVLTDLEGGMDDVDGNCTASYWRSALSNSIREASAIEARDNPCITDDKEGRVGWTW